jgi:2-keto-4-pentenoate hydratase/2-oxohepta-3-ene-1,7-dioic acid hydratase in catechol pathway
MRIVSFSSDDHPRQPGFLLPGGDVIAVRQLGPDAPRSVPDLLASWEQLRDRVPALLEKCPNNALRLPTARIRLHAPIKDGALLVCTGGNYRAHTAEYGQAVPQKPPSFVKNPNAVIATGTPIELPAEFPAMVDFEGELCVVFGRPTHRVRASDALDHVAGYTILNDVSARDGMNAMLHARTPEQGRWSVVEMLMGKQFPTFAPLGPAITTRDDLPDPAAIRLTTRLDDTVMQDASTADLVVGIPELIAAMSRYYSFAPGDVLSTGTPAGTGAAHTPPIYLAPGDRVTITVPEIGDLTNPVHAPHDH